jgi:hypothetical protein
VEAAYGQFGQERCVSQHMSFIERLFRRSPRQTRQFPRDNRGRGLRDGLSVEGLFAALEERKTRYLVLRWFEGLPEGQPDGDIDLLVHDSDVAPIADLFEYAPQSQQCDVFSVNGLAGTSYRGMPYLPPDKAAGMLMRATRFKDTCMVPSPEDHFLSLAYHAVYQKGLGSGLPTSLPKLTPKATPGHDYVRTLGGLANDLGIEAAISLEDLDLYLDERGWRPSPDVISKLALNNAWLVARFERAPE